MSGDRACFRCGKMIPGIDLEFGGGLGAHCYSVDGDVYCSSACRDGVTPAVKQKKPKAMKVEDGTEIELKRCYLPGVRFEEKCPECGEEAVMDFEGEYLSYPKTGRFDLKFRCWNDDCEHEWSIPVKLTIEMERVEEKDDESDTEGH